ncbi:MAG: polysaccharide deacetylase family protein [Rhizobiaceae bacterium]|jgi:peptidoglycan/xylan/chitin deacetylase (PgdA/CDA1 family)|nr:polysaccharide deacetylase family protein [Rhizobiaceae bacterium]
MSIHERDTGRSGADALDPAGGSQRHRLAALVGAARRAARRTAITGGLEAVNLASLLGLTSHASSLGCIFTLHHVRPHVPGRFDPNRHLSVTPEFLDAALGRILALGHQPVPLGEVPKLIAKGDASRRFFAVTLDDGNRNNAEFAAPVFRKHGVPYTIFVTKGLSERTATMWWETAAALLSVVDRLTFDFGNGHETVACPTDMEKKHVFNRMVRMVEHVFEDEAVSRINAAAVLHGVDARALVDELIMNPAEVGALVRSDPLCSIGAHGVTHCDLARATPERLFHEVNASVAAVAAWAGRKPDSFAYPYGFAKVFGARERAAVAAAGVPVAVTTLPGVLTAAHLGQLTALPRISLNGFYQKPRYVSALASGAAFRFLR